MATASIANDVLQIRLTLVEKVSGLLGDLDVPLHAVRDAHVAPDALAAVRGRRAPGLAIPGRRKIGTWRGRGGKRFVSVRSGQAAVRLTLTGQRYDELLLGMTSGEARALVDQVPSHS